MRGIVLGLASPHPLGESLPAIYAGNDFAQRWCQALDEVLAPVLATLDCLPAYLDPAIAPPDMVEWLADWVGVTLVPGITDKRRRQLVSEAARLYCWRGTLRGIRDIIELSTGQAPEFTESGACAWSRDPGAALPGFPEPVLIIRLRAAELSVEESHLAAIIAPFVPAHVPWRLELRR
jgi:phage tail-like protein